MVRTVSGRGFFKLHGKLLPLLVALAGFTIAMDPTSRPPYDIWFGHGKLGWVKPHEKRPTVEAAMSQGVERDVTSAEKEGDTELSTLPAAEMVTDPYWPITHVLSAPRCCPAPV